jgi:beta-glucosidase
MTTTPPAVRDAVAFPERFLWGAATASFQVEGAAAEGGRSPSIWDRFCAEPGRVLHGDTGEVGCDHFHRLDADLDLMAELGLQAYRFSIAWPRVIPDGRGQVNQEGLDFYRRLVDGLRDRGILPVATLYHWDLPDALGRQGGWLSRETPEAFGEYTRVVAGALGDGIGMWITLNEPWCSAWLGYAIGVHAPGRRDVGEALAAHHHLLVAHARALAALREALGSAARVGITLNLGAVRSASDHPDDLAAARRLDGNHNRIFLDPLFAGHYPEDIVEWMRSWVPGLSVVRPGEAEDIAAPLDFLGVNYYSPMTVAAASRVLASAPDGLVGLPPEPGSFGDAFQAAGLSRLGSPTTAMGWEIDPSGLRELLQRLGREVPVPLYITENGAACEDYRNPDGEVTDTERIDYLDGHLRAAKDAIDTGVDLRGYFAWSLMDNFEWSYGYSKRFGLIFVDYPTGERVPKASASWYREVIARNGLLPAVSQ